MTSSLDNKLIIIEIMAWSNFQMNFGAEITGFMAYPEAE
jgi:hypothetical protein